MFTAPVAVVGDSLALGERLSISVRVRNDAAASDDGRIVIGFPSFTDPADSALVSSTSVGDSPGYREFPSGAMVSDSTCQSAAAAYLAVEYADSDWQWLGTETDTLTLTVQPRAVGTLLRRAEHHAGDRRRRVSGGERAAPAGGSAGSPTRRAGRCTGLRSPCCRRGQRRLSPPS